MADVEPLETLGANPAEEAELVYPPARTFPPDMAAPELVDRAIVAGPS